MIKEEKAKKKEEAKKIFISKLERFNSGSLVRARFLPGPGSYGGNSDLSTGMSST